MQLRSRREEERRDCDRLTSESRSRSRSSSRVSTTRDRIRCFKCREYDHFANNCPNSITDEDSDQGELHQVTLPILTQDNPTCSDVSASVDCLKFVKGENGSTSFLPLNSKGGPFSYVRDRNAICSMEEQTKYVYKKVEQGNEINTDTKRQEIDQERLTETKTEKEDEINPYQKVVLNNV